AAVPVAGGPERGPLDPEGALEGETPIPRLARGGTEAEAVAVGVPPGAQGLQFEADGARAPDQPVNDGRGRAAMGHGHLAPQCETADRPAPPGYGIDEGEGLEMLEAG